MRLVLVRLAQMRSVNNELNDLQRLPKGAIDRFASTTHGCSHDRVQRGHDILESLNSHYSRAR